MDWWDNDSALVNLLVSESSETQVLDEVLVMDYNADKEMEKEDIGGDAAGQERWPGRYLFSSYSCPVRVVAFYQYDALHRHPVGFDTRRFLDGSILCPKFYKWLRSTILSQSPDAKDED